jgi:hypothetical protein
MNCLSCSANTQWWRPPWSSCPLDSSRKVAPTLLEEQRNKKNWEDEAPRKTQEFIHVGTPEHLQAMRIFGKKRKEVLFWGKCYLWMFLWESQENTDISILMTSSSMKRLNHMGPAFSWTAQILNLFLLLFPLFVFFFHFLLLLCSNLFSSCLLSKSPQWQGCLWEQKSS